MMRRTPSDEMWSLIEKALYKNDMKKKDLALRTGFHVNTVAQDAKRPARIPLGRLLMYFDVLNIPINSILKTVSSEISCNGGA